MTKAEYLSNKLSKFIEYILGRHPDEFGLIPDAQGFVKIKTLLQAMHEDPEWRHVRQGQLNALMLMEHPAPIEIQDAMVRVRTRDQLPSAAAPLQWPKLLYTTVRQRAYPVVHEKGIQPGGSPFVVLSLDVAMAQRLGRRMDNHPVLLTIQVDKARSQGTQFRQYGERLFLADFIPKGCFSGPPIPKEKEGMPDPKASSRPKAPGSYFPELAPGDKHGAPPHQRAKRNEIDWKKDRRRARREKARQGYG